MTSASDVVNVIYTNTMTYVANRENARKLLKIDSLAAIHSLARLLLANNGA